MLPFLLFPRNHKTRILSSSSSLSCQFTTGRARYPLPKENCNEPPALCRPMQLCVREVGVEQNCNIYMYTHTHTYTHAYACTCMRTVCMRFPTTIVHVRIVSKVRQLICRRRKRNYSVALFACRKSVDGLLRVDIVLSTNVYFSL